MPPRVTWQKASTRVRSVIAARSGSINCAASSTGLGRSTSRTTSPSRAALARQGFTPTGCSWLVVRISSPARRPLTPSATNSSPTEALRLMASSSGRAPISAASSGMATSSL